MTNDKNHIYIYHHLGLGDHISCHGIVRYYCEEYKKVSIFAKPKYANNIKYMYNDIQNLEIIPADDPEVRAYIDTNKLSNVLYVGFRLNPEDNFVAQFYKMANVPIEYEYTKFYINRDLAREKKLFDSLQINEYEYIFVHDESIKNSELITKQNLPIIIPNHGDFFDWIYTILHAKEIHCIDSSFVCLVDLLDTKDIPIFNHRYAKNYPAYITLNPKPHKFWNIIK